MRTFLALLIITVFSSVALSQNNQIELYKLKNTIKFDGDVNDIEWKNTFTLSNFKQFEPNLGEPSTEKPLVYLTYDNEYLYIGAYVLYNDPSKLFARVMERDVPLDRDDFVEIHIDSYNDHINSLVFSTNALGARYDYEVSRNGQEINRSWNTFWDVKTMSKQNGWTMEMRIPFISLRYNKSDLNLMRIKAVVKYKYNNERVITPLNNIDRQPVIFQYRNAYEIALKDLPKAKSLFITPYVKGGFLSSNTLNEAEDGYTNSTQIFEEKGFFNNSTLDKVASNVGVDIKYKPNTNQTLDVTLNTDFAQVEADDRIINLTRFPIFFPEKRLFFLENADLFNSNQFDHRLFHSRRIGIQNGQTVPIIGGVRFVSNNLRSQYGFLSMQTNKVDDLLPSENLSVLRYKQNVGNLGSYIGFLGTSKLAKDNYNYLLALDGSIRVKQNLLTEFTLASTFDKFLGNWKYSYGALINTFKSNGFGIEYRYRDYGEGFNPELGFVSRPNTKRLTLNHGWRKAYNNHSFLRRIAIGNWLTRYWVSSNGKPEFFQTNIYLSMGFKSGYGFGMFAPIYQSDHLFSDWSFSDNITIPIGKYTMWKFEPFFSTGNAYIYRLSGGIEVGEFYGGNQATFYGTLNYDFTKNFQAELGTRINRFSFPDSFALNGDTDLEADIWFTKLKFSFSSSSFLNMFVQYDSRQEKIGWNLRFRCTPNEATNLYVVYNHNINNDRGRISPRLPVTDNAGLTVKFSKTFF